MNSLLILGLNLIQATSIDRRKFAFATVAVNEDNILAEPYLLSALAMGQALREVKSLFPLVVLVSSWDVKSQRRLRELCRNCIVRLVAPLQTLHPARPGLPANWASAWSKLHLWDLPYDKVVYLDADVVIMKNIDALFDYPSLTLARNRCGLCCSHALGTDEAYSTGMMTLEPNIKDKADLLKTLTQTWDSELHAIQAIIPVAAVFPDVDNVFTITTLASCGCRPGDPNSSYVASLPAIAPMQNKVKFTAAFQYFPGIRDEDVRTAHAFNPKPWFAKKVPEKWEVPCGGQFITKWHELVHTAMTDHRPVDDQHEWDRLSTFSWFQHSVDSANISKAPIVKEILHECPEGAVRNELSTALRLLWSPHGVGVSTARAIRKILSPWMLTAGMKPLMHTSDELDRCLRQFVHSVQEWIEAQVVHNVVMASVSSVLSLVIAALPAQNGR